MSKEKAMTHLSPPWWSYQRKVKALFGSDPEVRVRDLFQEDEGNYTLFIIIRSEKKAQAIRALLPRCVEFGGTTVTSRIFIPVDECEVRVGLTGSDVQLVREAFTGNPVFDRIEETEYKGFSAFTYCIFKKEVIQFWNDDLSNFYGLHTTLAENLADDILRNVNVQFCTGIE